MSQKHCNWLFWPLKGFTTRQKIHLMNNLLTNWLADSALLAGSSVSVAYWSFMHTFSKFCFWLLKPGKVSRPFYFCSSVRPNLVFKKIRSDLKECNTQSPTEINLKQKLKYYRTKIKTTFKPNLNWIKSELNWPKMTQTWTETEPKVKWNRPKLNRNWTK